MAADPPAPPVRREDGAGGERAAKRALREATITRRAALSPEIREAAAAAIAVRVLQLPSIRTARRVLAYAAFGDEVSVDLVLQRLLDQQIEVSLPYIDRQRPDLGTATIASLDDVVIGPWGIREPASRPAADPALGVGRADAPDVVLVPGLAFDTSGRRLGYGRGFYDRLLTDLGGVPTLGITLEALMVEAVPVEPHDRRLNAVVTEAALYRCGPPATPSQM